jgi:hypothetical protein
MPRWLTLAFLCWAAGCGSEPDDSITPVGGPPSAVLDSIRMRGDSITFVFAGAYTELRGVIAAGRMDGVMDVFAPLCPDCTSPLFVGTWTAVRL